MAYKFFLNDHTTVFRSNKPPYDELEHLNLLTGTWRNVGHKARNYENLGEVPRAEAERTIRTWGEPGVTYELEPGVSVKR